MRQGKFIASLLAVGLALGVAQEGQAADAGIYSEAHAMAQPTPTVQTETPRSSRSDSAMKDYPAPSSTNNDNDPARANAPVQIEDKGNDIFQVATLHYTVPPLYHLSRNDELTVSIIGFDDMNGIIGPDGRAQFPYIGSVFLEGLTVNEAQAMLSDKFSEYLRFDNLSVAVTNYAPRKVYVTGIVNHPGIQSLPIDSMNAYAAIASAGGATDRGRLSKTQVIRVQDGVMYYKQLDINRYIKKHDLTQNVELEDGDIVYVPDTNGIKFNEDVLPYINAYSMFRALTKD